MLEAIKERKTSYYKIKDRNSKHNGKVEANNRQKTAANWAEWGLLRVFAK